VYGLRACEVVRLRLDAIDWRNQQLYIRKRKAGNSSVYPLDAKVIQTCQPLVVPDTRQDPRWVTVAGSAWIRSHLSVPISLHNQVLGLLRLDGDVPNQFSPKDAKRLQPLASAAAIALENAQFYDQARQDRVERIIQVETEIIQLDQKLQTLQHASSAITSSLDFQSVLDTVTKEMANLLKVDGCAIFEWNQVVDKIYMTVRYGLDSRWEEGSLSREFYPLADYPLIKRVLVEQRPQQITSSHPSFYPAELALVQQAKLRTLLMLPMRVQDRVVGLVMMIDSQVERTFTNKEIALVQILANQVAGAIENNRLYAQSRQEITERLQIEKALRWVATRNQAILDAIPDSLFYFNGEGQLMGYKINHDTSLPPGILGEFTIGKNLNELLPADLADQTLRCIDQTLTSGTMELFEYQLPLWIRTDRLPWSAAGQVRWE